MNEQQYEQFNNEAVRVQTVGIDDLDDRTPRTLLFGYDISRATHHAYIDPVDLQIHVLKYVTTGPVGSETVLVLSHTHGLSGGVSRNDQFVPDKRLYPESCDLDFCRLLRKHDVSLPFTTFNAAGLARADRFNGFAGHLAKPDTPAAIPLASQVIARREDFGDVRLLRHLVHDACIESGVRYASLEDQILVAEPDMARVVAQVRDYCASMSPLAYENPVAIEQDLCSHVLLTWGEDNVGKDYPDRCGAHTFALDYPHGVQFREDVPVVARYAGEEGVNAVQGVFNGRPYLAVLEQGNKGYLHLNLYGSADRFISEMVKRHGLVPEGTPR